MPVLAVLILGWTLAVGAGAAAEVPGEPRFTPPPGEERPEVRALIDRAQAALASGESTTSLLIDPGYLAAHEFPRFRRLIRDHARDASTGIVTPQEPGDRLAVNGSILDEAGAPIKGALIYVYQTSARGWYSDRAPHVAGMSGDERHARLFGYLTTGADGKYAFRTVKPSGYPGSDLPAHIHVEIEAPGNRTGHLVTEIRFDDDARMTPEMRERSRREGYLICPVKRDSEAGLHVTADFRVPLVR